MLKWNETTPSYRLPEHCCIGRVSCNGKACKCATCACKLGMHEYLRCDTKGASLKDLRKYTAHGSDLLWRPNCVEGGALAGRLIGASLHDALPLQHGLDLCSSRVHTALLLSIILPHTTHSIVVLVEALEAHCLLVEFMGCRDTKHAKGRSVVNLC